MSTILIISISNGKCDYGEMGNLSKIVFHIEASNDYDKRCSFQTDSDPGAPPLIFSQQTG